MDAIRGSSLTPRTAVGKLNSRAWTLMMMIYCRMGDDLRITHSEKRRDRIVIEYLSEIEMKKMNRYTEEKEELSVAS